jgi:hypothetical protein
MKIGVIIPWREQPSRLVAFNALLDWYKNNMPNAKVYLADRVSTTWHMSASRNDGVRQAEADECDIVVVNDADTIPQLEPLMESIEAALKDKYIHNPYTEYRILDDDGTEDFVSGIDLKSCRHRTYNRSCSGVYVCTPQSWWLVGGQDEKFIGWAPEDVAMQRAHKVIHGINFIKHDGIVFALGHDKQEKGINFKNGNALYEKYHQTRTPDRMLKLVKS